MYSFNSIKRNVSNLLAHQLSLAFWDGDMYVCNMHTCVYIYIERERKQKPKNQCQNEWRTKENTPTLRGGGAPLHVKLSYKDCII